MAEPKLLFSMSARTIDTGFPSRGNAFFDMGHYHAFTPPTRMPSTAQLSSAVQGSSGHQLAGSDILFVLLASCALPERLRVADETWCGSQHDGVQCWAYMDCDQMPPGEMPLRSVRTVTASEYLIPWHAPGQDCCSPADQAGGPDGLGPSSHFCANASEYAAHVAQTLPAQYRFLPALHHASTTHLDEGKRWLVMVDDDSWVTIPRLLHVLAQHNDGDPLQVSTWRPQHATPPRARPPPRPHACVCMRALTRACALLLWQLGDFIPPQLVNHTHWKRPFACSGAGTVLSRAAVERTDWMTCMRMFAGTCQQSDWMIGRCLERANVTALVGPGCGTCTAAPGFSESSHANTLRMKLSTHACAFAQYPRHDTALATLFGFGAESAFELYALAVPAIVHGSDSLLREMQVCARPATEQRAVGGSDDEASEASWPLMLIGTPQAATDMLLARLSESPGTCLSSAQTGFFTNASRCAEGVRWYQSQFPAAAGCSIHVDATPLLAAAEAASSAASLVARRVFYTIPRARM